MPAKLAADATSRLSQGSINQIKPSKNLPSVQNIITGYISIIYIDNPNIGTRKYRFFVGGAPRYGKANAPLYAH